MQGFQKIETTGIFLNGCNNFRLQNVRIHDKSEGHLSCVGMADNTSSLEGHRTLKLLNSAAHAKLTHLFMNAHFLAKCKNIHRLRSVMQVGHCKRAGH
jgi:hypothetical protein